MKQKDFFSQLVRQGNITEAEATKFIETLTDVEIPDAFVKAHENSFMTMDRAAAHKDIHGKIKREVLDPVDNDLVKIYETIKEYGDGNLDNLIKSEQNTYNKLKAIEKILPDVIKKAKGAPQTDEETKKKLTAAEKTIQEFGDKFSTAEKDYNTRLSEAENKFNAQLSDYKLNSELEKLTNKYTLAEAFEKTRGAISKVTLAELRNSNKLKLGEKDGQHSIIVLDDEGKPKFNGNSPVTIDALLDEAYKPFLKKSESGPPRDPKTTVPVTTPPNSATRKGAPTAVR